MFEILLYVIVKITITLLIPVSIYSYLIKYHSKQKLLLPFHFINKRLKEILYEKYKSEMSNKVKDIYIKNRTYYFFNDIINIKIFIQIILK